MFTLWITQTRSTIVCYYVGMIETATESVRLRPSTKVRVEKLGRKGDTFDDIITKLLDKKV